MYSYDAGPTKAYLQQCAVGMVIAVTDNPDAVLWLQPGFHTAYAPVLPNDMQAAVLSQQHKEGDCQWVPILRLQNTTPARGMLVDGSRLVRRTSAATSAHQQLARGMLSRRISLLMTQHSKIQHRQVQHKTGTTW